MPRSMARIIRRGELFYFRMAVPRQHADLVGQREFKVSLRTSDPTEARVRGRLLCNALDVWFQGLKRMLHLPHDVIRDRLRGYFQACLNRSLEQSITLPHDAACDMDAEVAYLRSQVEHLHSLLKAQSFPKGVREDATAILTEGNPVQKPDHDLFQVTCGGVVRAKIENARILAAMLSGEYDKTAPLDPLFVGMAPNELPAVPGDAKGPLANSHTLATAADLFYVSKAEHDWAGKTAADVKRTLELAVAVIGDRPIRMVTVDDVRKVRDALAKLPPNYTKVLANKGLTVTDAIAANKGATLSLKTQDKYLVMFKQLLIWAEDEGYIDKAPGANVRVNGVGKTNPAGSRNPYSSDQLRLIFRSPLFIGHSVTSRHLPGPEIIRDGKFWVPLIALLTGMRMGEIVQLLRADIKKEHDIWFFDVTKGEDKKLKTASSKRRVPVHRVLIELGLLEHLSPGKATGRVFADIEPGKDGYYSHNFSKWWGRYSRHVGFKADRTTFHSFRHNFKDGLMAAELPEYVNKALLGHSDNSVHSNYGSGPTLAVLKSAVDKVCYNVDVGWVKL